MSERSPDRHEDELNQIAGNEQLAGLVPELTWRSKLTERGAKRILQLLSEEVVDASCLWQFVSSTDINALSPRTIEPWFEFLVQRNDDSSGHLLIDLMSSYYLRGDADVPIPEDLGENALLHPAFFRTTEHEPFPQMADYHWSKTRGELHQATRASGDPHRPTVSLSTLVTTTRLSGGSAQERVTCCSQSSPSTRARYGSLFLRGSVLLSTPERLT